MRKIKLLLGASVFQVKSNFQKFLRLIQISLAIVFLFSSSLAHAYYISYDNFVTSSGTNAQLVANLQSTSFSHSYNSFSSTSWIPEASGDGNGGVNVDWDLTYDVSEEFAGGGASLSFQILSDYGNLIPEPVIVDVEGYLYLDSLVNQPSLYSSACCLSESVFNLQGPTSSIVAVESFSNVIYENFEGYRPPDTGDFPYSFAQVIASGGIDESFSLMTNTTYNFQYVIREFVETTQGPPPPPSYFASWDEYNAFLVSTAGTLFSNAYAKGFTSFDMELTSIERPPESVPEPSILGLFGAGLIGLIGFSKRRKAA